MTFVVPMALVGGWWIFLAFLVVFVFVIALSYYTLRGSGISQTPYNRPDGPPESPSELAHDITQEVGLWERGTNSGRRRQRPPGVRVPTDPEVAAALAEWRQAPASAPRLVPPVGPEDHIVGPPGGPTVAVYVDLTSGPCRNAVRLLTGFTRQRRLRVAVRHLPLADVHTHALTAAEALEAAGSQGSFFDLLERLAASGLPDEQAVLAAGCECVPDPERLRAEVADGRYRPRIVQQIRQAVSSGARGVPEIYIEGEHYAGALTVDPLTKALDAVATG